MGKKRKDLSDADKEFIETNWDSMTVPEMASLIGWNRSTLRKKIIERYGKGKSVIIKCAVCNKEFSTRFQAYCCSKECARKRDWAIEKVKRIFPEKKYAMYISGARVRNYEFSLTFEEFMTYWQKCCAYCGDYIDTIGLDRVDNTKGYTIDNIVPCCPICNRMKSDMSSQEFLEHVTKILGRQA